MLRSIIREVNRLANGDDRYRDPNLGFYLVVGFGSAMVLIAVVATIRGWV